jgi:hypothetical protein
MDVSVRTAMATSFIDVLMNAQEAQDFHSHQIERIRNADLIGAMAA